MLKEIAEKYSQDEVSVHVVWLPMVSGDDERAARSTGRMYAAHPVHQYYDGQRSVGLSYRREVFTNCLNDALSVMPQDHPLYAELNEWASTPRGIGPLWDAVLFYPPGIEWDDHIPRPAAWSKQVAFFEGGTGDITGTFFRYDCKSPPVDSDWNVEVRRGLRAVQTVDGATQNSSLRIELLSFPGCPNTPKIRENLHAALASLGIEAKVVDVNLEGLKTGDARRGWGAPTILVNGSELMGLPRPTSKTLSCRVYSDGIPSADQIARRIQPVIEKVQDGGLKISPATSTATEQADPNRQIVLAVGGFT